MRDKMGID